MSKHTVNTAWHSTHRMPKQATIKQRINWHLQHQRNCQCKPIPTLVQKAINSREAAT